MTETERPQGLKNGTLLLRLAEPADQEQIEQLMRKHDGPSPYPIKFRREPKEGDELALAFLPSGQLAACVRLNIVTTPSGAKDQLGAFVHAAHLPALVLERSCALPGEDAFETLRMVILMLANDMYVDKTAVISQVDTGLATASTLEVLYALGYQDLLGRDANNFPLVLLPKARFKHVARQLRDHGGSPFFKWTGRLPFQHLLPDHVIDNWT